MQEIKIRITEEQAAELMRFFPEGETLEEKLQAFLEEKLQALTLDNFVPLKAAAATLGITLNAARKAIDRGRLEVIKDGGTIYVSKDSISEYAYTQALRHKKYERRETGTKREEGNSIEKTTV